MRTSSADGWHGVDHDHLIQLVAVEVGMIPALSLADLVEPEGGVRAVRTDDAPDRARIIEFKTPAEAAEKLVRVLREEAKVFP